MVYDVFLPSDVTFTLTYHPNPAYSVAIYQFAFSRSLRSSWIPYVAGLRASEAVPSLEELRGLQASLSESATLLIAVVDSGLVSFVKLSV